MERVSLPIEADIRVNGEQQMRQLSDSVKMSAEEMKRFKELGDWTNARDEIQNIEAMKNSLAQLAQEQAKSRNETPNNYSSKAMQIFDAEREKPKQQVAEKSRDTITAFQTVQSQNEKNNYSSKAMQIFDTEQKRTNRQAEQYSLNTKDIVAVQKDYREQEIQRLNEKIGVLNDSLKDLAEMYKKAEENGDNASIMRLANARSSTESEKSSLESKLKSLLKEQENSSGNKTLSKFFGAKEIVKGIGDALQFAGNVAQAGYTYRQDIANGNVIGASRREGTTIAGNVGGVVQGVGSTLMGAGTALSATGVGSVVGAPLLVVGGITSLLGTATKVGANIFEGRGQAGDAEAQAYMNNFDTKYGVLRSFRDVGGNEATNARAANEMFSKLTAASIGTGLDAGAISQLVQEAARQGVDETRAFEIASNAGKWNQATGANADTMLRLQGMAERYGLGQDVISTAYGGLKASNMQKAQLDEFLNGLQSVIEDGISNGYLKSADDIAAQMTMFASLSGDNPLWQGQNGANKIMQMNGGLSGATEMGNVAQTIAMGSAKRVVDGMSSEDFEKRFGHKKTGTYLDYEMALQNPSGEIYGQVLKDVKSYSGGNVAAQKEFLQQIFGINSTGTLLDLINMTGGNFSESAYKKVVDENKMTPNARTEQAAWSDSMSRLSESLNKIGEGEWKENVKELNDEVKKYLNKAITKEVGGNADVNKAILETGVDEETAKKAAEYSEKNYKEIVDVIPEIEDVNGGWNLKTGMAANSLAGIGEFAKSVSPSTALDISAITPFLNDPRLDGNNLYSKLYHDDIGKENLDNIFKDMVGRFAYANDKQVSPNEVAMAINYIETKKGKDVMNAYESGDEATFISALEKALENAFRRALPSELNVYSKEY